MTAVAKDRRKKIAAKSKTAEAAAKRAGNISRRALSGDVRIGEIDLLRLQRDYHENYNFFQQYQQAVKAANSLLEKANDAGRRLEKGMEAQRELLGLDPWHIIVIADDDASRNGLVVENRELKARHMAQKAAEPKPEPKPEPAGAKAE